MKKKQSKEIEEKKDKHIMKIPYINAIRPKSLPPLESNKEDL